MDSHPSVLSHACCIVPRLQLNGIHTVSTRFMERIAVHVLADLQVECALKSDQESVVRLYIQSRQSVVSLGNSSMLPSQHSAQRLTPRHTFPPAIDAELHANYGQRPALLHFTLTRGRTSTCASCPARRKTRFFPICQPSSPNHSRSSRHSFPAASNRSFSERSGSRARAVEPRVSKMAYRRAKSIESLRVGNPA